MVVTSSEETHDSVYTLDKPFYHQDRLQLIRIGKPIAPTLLQVHTEAWCNDNCSFCSYRKENGVNTEMLDLLQITSKTNDFQPIGKPNEMSGWPEFLAESLPKQMKEAGIPAIELTGGGEPTIWKHFDKLLENLCKEEIQIGLITNASALTDKRIELLAKHAIWIRCSMDAVTLETHKKIHRTTHEDFDRRIKSLKKLIEMRKIFNRPAKLKDAGLTLGISFMIKWENMDEMEYAADFYKFLGFDYIRFGWVYDLKLDAMLGKEGIEKAKSKLLQIKEKIEDENFKVYFEFSRVDSFSKSNNFDRCYYQQFVWTIGGNALVYPCCIMVYKKGYEMGDLRTQTLSEIIQSSHKKILDLDPHKCELCWLKSRNKTIEKSLNVPSHVNFV